MAKIDTSKLLPPKSSVSAIVAAPKKSITIQEKKTNIVSSLKPINSKSLSLSKDFVKDKDIKDEQEVNDKLVKIEKFFKNDLNISKKKAEVKRKEKEKQDFEEAEKRLELPKISGFKIPGISLPSLGFFERVKRFLFFTTLGWLLPKIIEFLPKLEGFAKIIGGVYKFAEGMFGKLFDGFMSLVKFGGDLKDKTLGFIAGLKVGTNGNFQKEFDKLEKQFNNFVNLSIVAGLLSADIGLAAVDEYNKWKKLNEKPPKTGEKPLGGKLGASAAAYKFTDVGRRLGTSQEPFKGTGRYRTEGQARAGGFALEKQRGKLSFEESVKLQQKQKPKPKTPSWVNKLLSKLSSSPLGKLAKPFSAFLGRALPFAGAGVGALDATARAKSGDKTGAWIAGASAALDGFAGLAGLSSLGFLSTIIGAPVAAALATAAGIATGISIALDVILLVRDVLNIFGVKTFSKGGKVVGKYQRGGRTGKGSSTRPVRRTFTPAERKPFKIKPPKTQPGKDVGGEKNIKKVFPDKSKRFITYEEYENSGVKDYGVSYTQYLVTERKNEGKKPNPYKTLTNTAKILKEIPLVGGIMGAAVDIALGQKPNKKVYQSISSNIGHLVDNLASQKTEISISSLTRQINSFADGGYVPPSRDLKKTYETINSGDLLAKALEPTIQQRVDEAIQSVQKELKKKTKIDEKNKKDTQDGGGEGVDDDTPGAKLRDGTNAQIEADLLEYFTALYGKTAAIGIVANLRRESGYRTKTPDNPRYEGMAQWSRNDRWPKLVKWAESKGLDPYSRNAQSQYLAIELKQLGTDKRIRQAKTPEEAASIFYNEFERGAHSRPVKGNAYNPDNPHENKNKAFIKDITKRNPDIGKRQAEVLEKPKFTGGVLPSTKIGGKQSKAGMRLNPITGEYKMHYGNDYPMPSGTPITVLKEGEVTRSEVNGSMTSGYGNLIEVRHPDGSKSVYAHLSERKVYVGDKIKSGTVIGTVGSTGGSTGPHLHFEYDNPNGSTETNWQTLNNRADKTFVFGNVKPSTAYKLAIKDGKEGIIEDGKWKPKKWTAEEKQRYSKANVQASKPQKPQQQSWLNNLNPANWFKSKPTPRTRKNEIVVLGSDGKMYYADIQGNKVYDEKGNIVEITKDKNTWLLRDIKNTLDARRRNVQNMQGGGLVSPSKPNRPIPNSFASYENYGRNSMIMIQPIQTIVEKPVYASSGGNSIITFPVLVGVNNNSDLASYRG